MIGWLRTNSQLRRELAAEQAKNRALIDELETWELRSWIRTRRPDPHVVYVCPTTLPERATEPIRRIQ